MQEIFVAKDPKSAYKEAVLKYGSKLELVSAKQITLEDGKLHCEITVEVDEDAFWNSCDFIPTNNEIDLQEEIEVLKSKLANINNDTVKTEDNGVSNRVKNLFSEKGISIKWLDNVYSSLLGSHILNDDTLLVSHILEEINDSLKVVKESLDKPKIIMLVGPTGVGKTTTIAKLAARYAYMLEKPYKVAFINLDSYKIGAVDQLGQYADIMQIEHLAVNSIESFMKALHDFSEHDIILVDTAGMSPYDTQKFIKTIEYVNSNIPRDIEVNLLLSATVKYEDMDDIYNNFSFLNLNSIIISKFDETKHLGTLLNFMLLYKIPMSYFSIGQEVPDDLLVASKEYLLERFIGDLDG